MVEKTWCDRCGVIIKESITPGYIRLGGSKRSVIDAINADLCEKCSEELREPIKKLLSK